MNLIASWQGDRDYQMTTHDLLSESVASAQIREKAEIAKQLEEVGGRIVLFGAGNLGRKAAVALRNQGIEPIAFADNGVHLHGKRVEGIPVFSPEAAAERWSANALFVVTTFLPNQGGVKLRLRELVSLGCKHTSTFLQLGWRYDGVLPHFAADRPSRLLTHTRHLLRVAALWSDACSAETFRQALAWRLGADFGAVDSPVRDQYFPKDIIRPNPGDIFVDGGAFNGDTLRAAPWSFSSVLAIEPDPINAAILRTAGHQMADVREVLLGDKSGTAHFDAKGTMASSRSRLGSLAISVATLDELTKGEDPTFIKLDIEGDELAALQGGIAMLKRAHPVVAVCVYHRPEDLWTIPLFLHEAMPRHRLFLRSHAWDGFELVAYAIPIERCLPPR